MRTSSIVYASTFNYTKLRMRTTKRAWSNSTFAETRFSPPQKKSLRRHLWKKNNNKCFFSVLQEVVGNISKYRETAKLPNHLKSRWKLGRCPPSACSPWIRHCTKVGVGSKTVDSCRLSLTGPVVSVDKESKANVR